VEDYVFFLIVGSVLALSLLIAHIASRLSVPALVAFLALGMLLGSDGIGDIAFTNIELARLVGEVGLVAILFEGGLSTSWRRLRGVAVPAILLSTIGVFVTAALTGVAAHLLFDFSWASALLLGAVVSSTDAAAVFATLRFTNIRRKLARTLEAETGGNDPVAIALTIGLISWIQQPAYGIGDIALLLVHQLGLGLLVGVTFGALAVKVFSHLPQSVGAFAPVASVAACALSFGIAGAIGGSGFLAVYLVGLAIGSTPSRYRSQLTMFHEGLAFLAQVAMFVVLGLLVFPHKLMPVAGASILLAVLLVLVVRPIAVWVSTFFSNFTWQERSLLGWAGLRGAVPIVLGTIVLSSHIEGAETIFNIVFFVVIVSALIQGTTLEWVAKRLGVIDRLSGEEGERPGGVLDTLEQVEFVVNSRHAIVGSMMRELGLPRETQIIKIKRGGKSLKPEKDTIIQVGDHIVVAIHHSMEPELEDVFTRWRRRV
jgi:cell volume regulation protein A